MGSLYLTWMADVLRDAGVDVAEYKDWKTRARSSGGFAEFPLCVMWHHTASSTSPDNDAYYMCYSSPDRPISNLMVDRTGKVWVLAAGATNTNGKGKSLQFSNGTVPQDKMNEHAVGMEICNAGTGEKYPVVQIDAAFLASNTINLELGNVVDDVSTHQFYAPDRKIDPAKASSVEGPWVPSSCTSSESWELSDLKAECRNRTVVTPPKEVIVSGSSSFWCGNGRLDNFVAGKNDKKLYHNWYDVAKSKWTNWEDLGGALDSAPSVTGSAQDGKPTRIDVTCKGVDDPPGLWHTWYTGGNKWHDWERIADWPG